MRIIKEFQVRKFQVPGSENVQSLKVECRTSKNKSRRRSELLSDLRLGCGLLKSFRFASSQVPGSVPCSRLQVQTVERRRSKVDLGIEDIPDILSLSRLFDGTAKVAVQPKEHILEDFQTIE